VKTGIPADEIMCSLADAIVMQNLSVLTRGNTLRHKVLLLGGPNTFLPFLQECWRKRIPETWDERGYDYPKDVPIEELIPVPDNAALYAAYGAVMYGMHMACVATSPMGAKSASERPRVRRWRATKRSSIGFSTRIGFRSSSNPT
jgi:activator of 2-hydroxyglutaryl-CoA dehydratase